jgi:tRNA (guanine-N7-)-methyltransferase
LPHAFVSSINKNIEPFSDGDLTLIGFFDARNYSLAFVQMRGLKFALTIKQKEGRFLVKPEKITRPSDLNLTKEAIALFCKNCCGEILSSNIALKKIKPKSPKLLDPLYFCKHPEFFDGEVSVEVGFGSGRHLLYLAKESPNKKFVGIEIHKPSIERVLRQCQLQGIDNVYVMDFDARLIMETVKPDSLSEVFVHFPVPWPDNPTRRVISESFLAICSRALKDGGYVELRSDDRDYFEYAFSLAMSLPKTKVDSTKNEPAEIVSKYEDRWLRKGKDIFEMRIYPQKESKNRPMRESFELGGEISVLRLNSLPKEAIVQDGVLISFEEVLVAKDGKSFAVKVTFGDVARPDRRYIVCGKEEAYYYPFTPLCVEAGRKAHKIIKEYLYGKNS